MSVKPPIVFLTVLSLTLLWFLLVFPQEALPAARDGLSLWMNTLIPTLLPFLILSDLLMKTGTIERLLKPLGSLFSVCFGLTPSGGYAMLLGLVCGFPMGARLSGELFKQGQITREEAEYLLTFASCASPAFLISYLGVGCFQGKLPVIRILLPVYLADLVCMVIFRIRYHRFAHYPMPENIPMSKHKKETSGTSSPGVLLDVSIMNGFETITRLGGYLLLFSILNAAIAHYWPFSRNLLLPLSGMMELTTGLHSLSQSMLTTDQKYLLSMAMVSFGGACVLAQTRSCLDQSLSVKPYFIAKLLNMMLTVLLGSVLLQIV